MVRSDWQEPLARVTGKSDLQAGKGVAKAVAKVARGLSKFIWVSILIIESYRSLPETCIFARMPGRFLS